MPFNWLDSYYGISIGIKIHGTIGKRWIYQVVENVQQKYAYYQYVNPDTPLQQKFRDLLKKAVQTWHTLSATEKTVYDQSIPPGKTMSGFNFFISEYINNYK